MFEELDAQTLRRRDAERVLGTSRERWGPERASVSGEHRWGGEGRAPRTASARRAPPRDSVPDELKAAAERLRLAGMASAGREAVTMWAALAGSTPGAVWTGRDAEAPADLVQRFREAVARRAAGEPLAYAVGLAAFRTLDLMVDRRVLIPRPETEGLVERVLAWARERWDGVRGSGSGAGARGHRTPDPGYRSWGSVLDIGTGSGCIALSLGVEGRFARIVATDISRDALAVARINVERVRPATELEFRIGSLFAPVDGERFDVIVSNPPYVTHAEFDDLDPSVKAFEPELALVAGVDGLQHTRAIIRDGARFLRPGGLLALELDCRRAAAVLDEARAAGWTGARIEHDDWGRERFLLATREEP